MRRQDQLHLRHARQQRGTGLLEALIALLVFSLGMLAMTRLQAKQMAEGTEAQNRLIATRMADELLSLALADPGANAACYTVPARGTCGASAARAASDAWRADVAEKLPLAAAPTATLDSGRLRVLIEWAGRTAPSGTSDTHRVERVTDVR